MHAVTRGHESACGGCRAERLLRQLGLRFDYAKAVDPRATVKALANAIIADPVPLLSSGEVLAWYQDITNITQRIHTAVNPAKPRIAFGACPGCESVVWGDPDEQYGECAECAKAGIRLPASTIRSWVKRGDLRYDADGKLTLSELVPLLKRRAV